MLLDISLQFLDDLKYTSVIRKDGGDFMAIVNIKDVLEGDVLGENLYKEGSLIIKRGNKLSKKTISKLKDWGFTSIEIIKGDEVNNPALIQEEKRESLLMQENEVKSHDSVPEVNILKKLFFSNLSSVGHEYRYGFALHDSKNYTWLEGLFIKFMSFSKVYRLMEKLKFLDDYTYLHSFDVFIFGSLFAKRIGLKNIEDFALGCLLHDIGKLDIPKDILNKQSALLSQSEHVEIRKHTIYGYHMLKHYNFSEYIASLAKYHHERVDGDGYPEGNQGDDISEDLKVISIADVYSALTLNRPYRDAYGSTSSAANLLNEFRDVENYYIYHFFRMLKIFPVNTIVELTDGTIAKVIGTNDKIPTFPALVDLDDAKQIEIPLNRDLDIKRIIRFGDKSRGQHKN